MNKRNNTTFIIATLFMLSVPVSSSIYAEEIERRTQISELEKSKFIQDLENRLFRDIKAYLNHEFFIIQADAQLENVEKYQITEILTPIPQPPAQPHAPVQQEPMDPQISAEEIPSQPTETDILSQMELETDDGINESFIQQTLGVDIPLPGIPIPPAVFNEGKKVDEKARKNVEALKKKQFTPPPPKVAPVLPPKPIEPQYKKEKQEKFISSQEEIRQMRVKVLIDDHVSPEQETFIRNLVIEKANLSFIRGDEIRILRSKFPAASILDEPIEDEPVEEEPLVEEEKLLEPVVDEEKPKELPWWEQYWLYLLIAAAVLLLLLLFFLMRRKPDVIEEAPVLESETSKKVEELIDKMHQKVDTVNENRLGALKEELVSLSVTDQKLVGEQIKELLDSGNEDNLTKSAVIYQLLGDGLFKGLSGSSLTPEKQVAMAAKTLDLDESISVAVDEKLEIAESVYQMLMQRRYQQQHNMQDEVRPFAFLEKLNDDQILFLLKEEDLKVKSLVMSQLSSNRGASLLKRFPEKGRSKVAIEISNFSKLPVAAFRDIANRLAKMAVHVPSFENLEVDGINLLTDMLDHMNSAEETSLLKGLRNDNPDLYYQIRQIYVSFEDLVTIPKMGLKNLVREIERDDLALALIDMDDSFKETIFSVMLEKPSAMLKSAMEGIKNPDADAVEEAKRNVSRKARAMLKSGVFKMPRAEVQQKKSA